MKGLKKGIALIAVLAFLITAVLPAAAFAASPGESAAQVAYVGQAVTLTSDVSGVQMPSADGSEYYLRPAEDVPTGATAGPELPRSAYEVDVTSPSAGVTRFTITIAPGILTEPGSYAYDFGWLDTYIDYFYYLGTPVATVAALPSGMISWAGTGGITTDDVTVMIDGTAVTTNPYQNEAAEDVTVSVSATNVPENALPLKLTFNTTPQPTATGTGTAEDPFTFTVSPGQAVQFNVEAPMPPTTVTLTPTNASVDDDGTVTVTDPTQAATLTPDPADGIWSGFPSGWSVTDGVLTIPANALPAGSAPVTVTYTTPDGTKIEYTIGSASGGTTTDIPMLGAAGIYTGADYLKDPSTSEKYLNPFTYWTQPTPGLFDDGQETNVNYTGGVCSAISGTGNRPTFAVGTQPGGINGNYFQIGPDNVAVSPPTGTAGGSQTDPATNLTVNDRIEIYFNPQNITVDNGASGLLQLDQNTWADYVTMEWEYKPSTNDEDDGNPLKIPAGFGFSGIRSPLLTISPLTASMDGWWVRLAVYPINGSTVSGTNDQEYWTTSWIRLDLADVNSTLDPVVTITSNPEAVGSMVNVPRTIDAVLTAHVDNQPIGSANSYQWQSLAKPTAAEPTPAWVDVAGGTEQSLVLSNLTTAQSGVSYRCLVTCIENGPAGIGTVNESNSLTLNVTEPNGSVFVSGTTPSNTTANGEKLIFRVEGDTFAASVAAKTDNGDPMAYQWYVRSYLAPVPDSVLKGTVADAAAYLAGAAASQVTDGTGVQMTSEPLKEGVYGFSCRVENATNPAMSANSPVIYVVVTREGQLNVIPEPGTVRSVGVVNGQSITLTASAKAPNVSYTWQRYNSVTGQWNTLTATGKTLVLPVLTTTATGTLYRCAISAPGAAEPVYTGWYLINVWDTANTPQITKTAQNVQWTQSQLSDNVSAAVKKGSTIEMLSSTARVAQDLSHGLGPVYAIWYNQDGAVVSAQCYGYNTDGERISEELTVAELNLLQYVEDTEGNRVPLGQNVRAGNDCLFTGGIAPAAGTEGTYVSTLSLSERGLALVQTNAANAGRSLNGEYTCVWYKPQNSSEWLEPTVYQYWNTESVMDNLRLLVPQGTKGTTTIRIQIPGDPWIITDLPDEMTVSVGGRATLQVAAVITQPSDTTQPVYTWQVSENGTDWRNCLSSDGTGQFTNTFTTRVMTQEDYDSNTTLTYRVIVASRPNVTKIVSNDCDVLITEGTQEAPVITPGSGSPITVENGQATGITVSKDGTTVSEFLSQLNMTVPAGHSLRIAGSDGEALASDAIVYTGCVLELVDDATGSVVDMATIIVMGDVLGTGVIGINQVVRMAQDLNGSRPLEGIYAQAGDFNGSGSIDIADLVREAQILSEPVDVQK